MKRSLRSAIVVAAALGATLLTAVISCSTGEPAQPPGREPAPEAALSDRTTNPDAGFDACARPSPPDATPADCGQIPMPDGGRIRITGVVLERGLDGSIGAPIPFANVSVEYGGLYVDWCDRSRASPYYVFGTVADDAGRFELSAREGHLGFHSFATGYFYDRGQIDAATDDASVVLTMVPLRTEPKPVVTDPRFDKTTVEAGAPVTFTAGVRAANRCLDPMSDEVLLIEPVHSWSRELDPPSRGLKDDVPDGVWKLTFDAPAEAGVYTYYFSATTSQCVTSDVQTFTLRVE